MKILITSDWHGRIPAQMPMSGVDLVIYGGDLSNSLTDSNRLIKESRRNLDQLPRYVHVIGNHEYYDGKLMKLVEDRMVLPTGVEYFPGVSVFFCTGWYDWSYSPIDQQLWQTRNNDAKYLTPEFLASQREIEARRLTQFLDNLTGVGVIATHVPPLSTPAYRGKWAGNDLNGSFFSTHLAKIWVNHRNRDRIRLWAFGHIHEPWDEKVWSTRFVCAPFGHRHESWCGQGYRIVEV